MHGRKRSQEKAVAWSGSLFVWWLEQNGGFAEIQAAIFFIEVPVIHYAYLSPHKYENSSEILHALESKAPPISLRTYYARREEAIELLSSVLWGYVPAKFE